MTSRQSSLQPSKEAKRTPNQSHHAEQFSSIRLSETSALPVRGQNESNVAEEGNVTSKKHKRKKKKKKKPKNYCKPGDIVGDRFYVSNKFKEGGFGQIYKAFDTDLNNDVALKVERCSEDNLECRVLKKLQNKPHFPTIYASGSTKDYIFVAMELLGKNLSDIRKDCKLYPQRMSVSSTLRATIQCMEGLESLHDIGYIHRDIKPSNYAVGCREKDRTVVYLLDFGLSRYCLDRNGTIKPARPNAGFRGTVRYAALASHQLKDLSMRDDLWSIFYSFYELLIGQLHWRKTNDKKEVEELKVRHSPDSMCYGLPKEVAEFVALIKVLRFEDKPNYKDMYACFNRFLSDINVELTDVYDWQVEDCRGLYHWLRCSRSKARSKIKLK